MQLVAEHGTELLPNQTAQAVKPLSEAKQALTSVLRNLQDQKLDIAANQQRLTEAQKQEADLLVAAMDEQEQIRKLGEVTARQRLLGSRIEQGLLRLESLKGELRHAAEEALRSFWSELSPLRDSRTAANLASLKKLVNPEQWPWAESHALLFIQFASDVVPLDRLGDQAHDLLRTGAVRQAAEQLLMDIAKLETEKAGKR